MDKIMTVTEATKIFESLTPEQQETAIIYLRSLSEAEEEK